MSCKFIIYAFVQVDHIEGNITPSARFGGKVVLLRG